MIPSEINWGKKTFHVLEQSPTTLLMTPVSVEVITTFCVSRTTLFSKEPHHPTNSSVCITGGTGTQRLHMYHIFYIMYTCIYFLYISYSTSELHILFTFVCCLFVFVTHIRELLWATAVPCSARGWCVRCKEDLSLYSLSWIKTFWEHIVILPRTRLRESWESW